MKRVWKTIETAVLLVLAALILLFSYYCISYYIEEKSFKSFDLQDLNRKEFIFQTIEFKKFLAYGTDGTNPLADELAVYYVSGKALVSFAGIDRLVIDKESSDYAQKILRLTYLPAADKKTPFTVDIQIQPEDIYQVASYESEKLFGKIDLVKNTGSQAELVGRAKKQLLEEFEAQLIEDGKTKENRQKSDVYASFLRQLTEMIRAVSDWESVEINF